MPHKDVRLTFGSLAIELLGWGRWCSERGFGVATHNPVAGEQHDERTVQPSAGYPPIEGKLCRGR
jgi:hypothetical protein